MPSEQCTPGFDVPAAGLLAHQALAQSILRRSSASSVRPAFHRLVASWVIGN